MRPCYIETSYKYAKAHLEKNPVYFMDDDANNLHPIDEKTEIPDNAHVCVEMMFSTAEAAQYIELAKQRDAINEKLDLLKAKFLSDADAATEGVPKGTYAAVEMDKIFYVKESNSLTVLKEEPLKKLPKEDLLEVSSPKYSINKKYKGAIISMLAHENTRQTSIEVLEENCKLYGRDPSISKEIVKKFTKSASKNIKVLEEALGVAPYIAADIYNLYISGCDYEVCLELANACGVTYDELEDIIKQNVDIKQTYTMCMKDGTVI